MRDDPSELALSSPLLSGKREKAKQNASSAATPPATTLHMSLSVIALGLSDVEVKIATARFFADHSLVQAPALRHQITAGSAATLEMAEEAF